MLNGCCQRIKMRIKFFNNIVFALKFMYFYKIYFLLFKIQLVYHLKRWLLFAIPKGFSFFIFIYKRNFLLFYVIDFFLSAMVFLYFIDNSLNVLFPIAGVVYNKTMFEENIC